MSKAAQELGKAGALAALRRQLGTKVVSGSEYLRLHEAREPRVEAGLAGLKEQLGGGLPEGQLVEIVGTKGGGGLVLAALLAEARQARRYVVWVDVGCGFSPEGLPERDLEVLLWVGCGSAAEAVEALDVATRDENFGLFLVDLRGATARDWRSTRPAQWQRILGQLRQHGAAAVLFADEPVTSAAKKRVRVEMAMGCADLDREREQLWAGLSFAPGGAVVEQGDWRGSPGERRTA